MKIIALQASNIKKLTAVSITPSGDVITLAGDNGAGKSSVLDAITYALGGTSDVCEQPIRRGASEAAVVCQLEGLTVTRKFSGTGSTLKVTDAEGKAQRSPQAILDALVGNLAFDPLEFSRLKPADQAECLRKLVGLDFSALDNEKIRVYSDRTVIGREVDILSGKLSGRLLVAGVPSVEVDVTDVIKNKNEAAARNKMDEIERDKLRELNNLVAKNTSDREKIEARISEVERELAKLKESLSFAKGEFDNILGKHKTQSVLVAALVDEDLSAFDAQLVNAAVTNDAVRKNREYVEQTNARKIESNKYDLHTARLAEIESERLRLLAAAKFPLPELSFSADGVGVTYNGFPFAQASDGEKLRVSVAIGMALNPKLRVIFIRDGSLLDANGLRVISELAAANNYQVWLEDARSTDPTAVIIEDGHVKESV